MVEVVFQGRLGNNLSQYATGRIVAEKLSRALTFTQRKRNFAPIGDKQGISFFSEAKPISGLQISFPTKTFVEDYNNPFSIDELCKFEGKIILDGWFQHTDYYKGYHEQIKEWFKLDTEHCKDISTNDIVLNLRLGEDYNNEKRCWIIDGAFYHHILENYTYHKVYICTDDPKSPYIEQFQKYNPILVSSGDIITDFKFVQKFNNIALSTSSFSWWAAFLSEAEKIFLPDTRESITNCWRSGCHFVDEDRYINIPVKGLNENFHPR